MKKQTSKSLELNGTDWKSRWINVVIFFAPVIVLIWTQLQNWNAVDWKLVWITALWLALNLFKKFVLDYSTPVKDEPKAIPTV